jgi:4-hydroxy-3-polyprenylbenzoate decarboxylase
MVFGGEPLLFWAGAQDVPWHEEELSWIGHAKGKPVEVIRGKYTGLPIPAQAEIAIEGFAPPPLRELRKEGPFGEYTGYYGSGTREEPIVYVKAIYHRNDPILFGQPPLKPPYCCNWPLPIHSASLLWDKLERVGQRGITGIWVHGTNGMVFPVVSIRQEYNGHSGEIGTLAAVMNYKTKIAIVVDDDIDPSNWEDVMWAVASRYDPGTGVQTVPGIRGSALDPWVTPERRAKRDFAGTALVINACRPYYWKDQFPPVNKASEELRRKVKDKHISLFK